MFTINNFAILALAGTTIAAPALQERGWGGWRQGGWNHGAPESTSTVWDVATATVTMTGEAPSMTWAPAPVPTPEAETTEAASPAAFYTAWTSEAAPEASSASWAAPSAAPAPATGGYMDVVSKWRAAGGLSALSEDSTLQANALKTSQDGNGEMVHELNPGSMAQVLGPGDSDNFESVYVGGWLCESPGLKGLDGICGTEAQGWDHSNGETGHADILTSTGYSKIGCALANGIWACDLA